MKSYTRQNLSLFNLPQNFRGRSALYVQLWWMVQAILFGLSPQFMYGWRRFLLKLFGASIGRNVIIRPSARITYPWKLEIGEASWIGDDVVLYTLGKIKIGRDTVISQMSYICAGAHDPFSENFEITSPPITIGDGVWVSSDCFVGPNVNIADGVVVGARSTVLNDLPEGYMCWGNPAKPVRLRVPAG